jgi:hypothetical protein
LVWWPSVALHVFRGCGAIAVVVVSSECRISTGTPYLRRPSLKENLWYIESRTTTLIISKQEHFWGRYLGCPADNLPPKIGNNLGMATQS